MCREKSWCAWAAVLPACATRSARATTHHIQLDEVWNYTQKRFWAAGPREPVGGAGAAAVCHRVRGHGQVQREDGRRPAARLPTPHLAHPGAGGRRQEPLRCEVVLPYVCVHSSAVTPTSIVADYRGEPGHGHPSQGKSTATRACIAWALLLSPLDHCDADHAYVIPLSSGAQGSCGCRSPCSAPSAAASSWTSTMPLPPARCWWTPSTS